MNHGIDARSVTFSGSPVAWVAGAADGEPGAGGVAGGATRRVLASAIARSASATVAGSRRRMSASTSGSVKRNESRTRKFFVSVSAMRTKPSGASTTKPGATRHGVHVVALPGACGGAGTLVVWLIATSSRHRGARSCTWREHGPVRIGMCFPRELPARLVTTFAERLDAGGVDELWVIE